MDNINLVLNINKPNFFNKPQSQAQTSSNTKRRSENDSPNDTKKRKISYGKHFRVSSHKQQHNVQLEKAQIHGSKAKLNQESHSQRDKIPMVVKDKIQSPVPVLSNSQLKSSDDNQSRRKGNVKFSFSTKVHHYNAEGSPNEPSSTPQANKHRILSDSKTYDAKQKPLTSCLFTKNPEIPHLPKSDKSSLSGEVFSKKSFKELNIHPHLQGNLDNLGFESTTIVQARSIPPLLEGKDVLIKSQTGSGKTLAYALPIIHKLMQRQPRVERKDGTYALIIVPTRELALQTYKWFEKICKACVWIVPGYLIGGEKKKAEKGRLRKGLTVLIATPGRLLDHMDTTCSLILLNVQYLVIDEADRMLELGYEKSIEKIVHTLNEKKDASSSPRQNVLLSATLTSGVEKLAGFSLNSPIIVDATSSSNSEHQSLNDDSLATPQNLMQYYVVVPSKLRLVTLAAFILSKCKFGPERKMLVFMTTQDMVDYHTSLFSFMLSRFTEEKKTSLQKRAENVLAGNEDNPDEESDMEEDESDDDSAPGTISFLKLHGSMNQSERSAIFKTFSESSAGVLICTDVAARGLDLPKVNWIVQYNAACTATDYVHRVGRTARADTEGSALVFLTPAEISYVSMLEEFSLVLTEMEMTEILKDFYNPSIYRTLGFCRNEEVAAIRLQGKFEDHVADDDDMHIMAKAAYLSFIRSYASYPKQAREIFVFKSLHLGHYAKSFGLRDTPQELGSIIPIKPSQDTHQRQRQWQNRKSGHSNISEFDSGLEPLEDSFMRKRKSKSKRPTFVKKRFSVKASKIAMRHSKRPKNTFKDSKKSRNPSFKKKFIS